MFIGLRHKIIPYSIILVQQLETANQDSLADLSALPSRGRILAIDPGTKRCGVAVSDALHITTRPLERIERTSWKKLLSKIRTLISEFDAQCLVIGLPLESDGSESDMSHEAREMARKFALSLEIPVILQDERVTSYEAKGRLWQRRTGLKASRLLVDSEAASIILEDFIDRLSRRQNQ